MNNRKYPKSLFIFGFITNIVFHFFLLFVLSVIFLIMGIFSKPCRYISLGILLIDIVLSLIEQIRIRQAFLAESDNPDFQEFQNALSAEGNWRENILELLNQKISNSQNQIEADIKNDDK